MVDFLAPVSWVTDTAGDAFSAVSDATSATYNWVTDSSPAAEESSPSEPGPSEGEARVVQPQFVQPAVVRKKEVQARIVIPSGDWTDFVVPVLAIAGIAVAWVVARHFVRRR